MNNEWVYVEQIYTAFICVSELKPNGSSVTAVVLFCFGAAPLSKKAHCSHLGSIV